MNICITSRLLQNHDVSHEMFSLVSHTHTGKKSCLWVGVSCKSHMIEKTRFFNENVDILFISHGTFLE